jgi:hypothetical protein
VANGVEPIADDELLFRRVPMSMLWYDPVTRILKPEAFGPNKKRDTTGISVSRQKYKSAELAARGRPGKAYCIAVLRAGDIKRLGIMVEPRPITNDPGHAELPQLNAETYKDSATLERQRQLVSVCLRVEGPFETPQA